MAKYLREVLEEAFPEDRTALTEVEAAINHVQEHHAQIELYHKRLAYGGCKHEIVKQSGLLSRSEGEEPFRRLVVYPAE